MSYEETTGTDLLTTLTIDIPLFGVAGMGLVAYLRSRGIEQGMQECTLRWIQATLRRTQRPYLESREWDAFGHCWASCETTRLCGTVPTALVGTTRELLREAGMGGPHDSFIQDVRNQAVGRGLSRQQGKTSVLCDQAYQSGRLDLTAPLTNERWGLHGRYLV